MSTPFFLILSSVCAGDGLAAAKRPAAANPATTKRRNILSILRGVFRSYGPATRPWQNVTWSQRACRRYRGRSLVAFPAPARGWAGGSTIGTAVSGISLRIEPLEPHRPANYPANAAPSPPSPAAGGQARAAPD